MFKKYKNKIIISSLVIIGILLILSGSIIKKNNSSSENGFDEEAYTKKLEEKTEDFLRSVKGIKDVKVIISLDSSNEKVYAQNKSTSDYLTVNSSGGAGALYLGETYPTIRGVAVSCTNGDDASVQVEITELICRYLGISSNRVKIVPFG